MDETCSYMEHLGAAIDDAKTDYVAGAVVEIATMRADLDEAAHQGLTVLRN